MEEPLILTADRFVLSGHRRFKACQLLGMERIPCRIKHDIRRVGNDDYLADLAAYNPQRIKSVGALLREAILRDSATLADTQAAIRRVADTHKLSDVPTFIEVNGEKHIEPIGPSRQEFLRAVQKVVEKMRHLWPLTLRQIHYRLLNDPPLKRNPERSIFDVEAKYRYRNDESSYDALSRLVTSARYLGQIPFSAVDDPTRTFDHHPGFDNVSEFVEEEIDGFLLGYHRNKQQSQPIHIEVLAEKNTLLNVLRPICADYDVAVVSGRGFAGPSIWSKMAARFSQSGKSEMALLIVSDYDPEGLELADDAIRALRDLWEVPVNYYRVAVNREQIEELGLHGDFNPAKVSSSRFKEFVRKTGSNKTWECEALEPEYLRGELAKAIETNMNMELFHMEQYQEEEDTHEIHRVRQEIAGGFAQ